MIIEIPTKFDLNYNPKNLKYYNNYNKELLMRPLLAVSQGFCMYCGKSLINDGDITLHMEHSVDKGGNGNQYLQEETFLTHCKFNFSVSCPKCNTDCKKKVWKVIFGNRDKDLDCSTKKCTEMCVEYMELRKEYIERNAIILQPHGYEVAGMRYRLGYNILKHQYEPFVENRDMNALFFIENHINRFRLNGTRFTYSVIDLAAKVVLVYNCGVHKFNELFLILKNDNYSNILGILFLQYLEKNFVDKNIQELIEFCELVVLLDALD